MVFSTKGKTRCPLAMHGPSPFLQKQVQMLKKPNNELPAPAGRAFELLDLTALDPVWQQKGVIINTTLQVPQDQQVMAPQRSFMKMPMGVPPPASHTRLPGCFFSKSQCEPDKRILRMQEKQVDSHIARIWTSSRYLNFLNYKTKT